MSGLKTLKDFRIYKLGLSYSRKESIVNPAYVKKDDLKQEAIKHIKNWQEQESKISNIDLLDNMKAIEYNRLDAQITEFKNFFNIIDEDLK